MNVIASMTAFARKVHESAIGTLTCELRSVNHRYLDLNLYVPDSVRVYEKELRELLQHSLGRGKIDLLLKFQPKVDQAMEFVVNQELVAKLVAVSHDLAARFVNSHVNMVDLLKWPDVLQPGELDLSTLEGALMAVVQSTINDLIATRQREGAAIKLFMEHCLTNIETQIALIRERLPVVLHHQREKILSRFAELQVSLEPARLEQEFVWLAQKTDIAEEIQRLETHVQEVMRILTEGGVVGRRLDFLMQELNREANTIGSKSMDAQVTQADVELKVLIEQMREQVQNLE